MKSFARGAAALALGIAGATAGVAYVAAPAQAATCNPTHPWQSNSAPATAGPLSNQILYSGPSTSCGAVAAVSKSVLYAIDCYAINSAGNVWLHIGASHPTSGWIQESHVIVNNPHSLGRCGS